MIERIKAAAQVAVLDYVSERGASVMTDTYLSKSAKREIMANLRKERDARITALRSATSLADILNALESNDSLCDGHIQTEFVAGILSMLA